jgi:[ribosomal protein S18]-alanine N-acetyltransferase
VIVRTAVSSDAAAISDLAREGALPPFDSLELERSAIIVLVAELDGQLAGFATISCVADESELLAIGVRASLRRRGVARALLHEALARARSRGAEAMFLEVRASNLAARAFYSREGFEEIGARRGYYADGEDAILMRVS